MFLNKELITTLGKNSEVALGIPTDDSSIVTLSYHIEKLNISSSVSGNFFKLQSFGNYKKENVARISLVCIIKATFYYFYFTFSKFGLS